MLFISWFIDSSVVAWGSFSSRRKKDNFLIQSIFFIIQTEYYTRRKIPLVLWFIIFVVFCVGAQNVDVSSKTFQGISQKRIFYDFVQFIEINHSTYLLLLGNQTEFKMKISFRGIGWKKIFLKKKKRKNEGNLQSYIPKY